MRNSIRQTSAPLAALLSAQAPTLLDALPAHIALLDDRGCIVAVNASWRQFAEANSFRDPDQGVGESYLQVCERCDDPAAREVGDGLAALLAGERRQFELEYPCHAPQEQRWFRLMASALDHGGRTVGAVVMHVDITKLRRTEQKLQEARDAAEAANRAKDHFLAMLSHELRTPLAPVLATVSRLQDDPRLRGLRREMALVRRNVELEARLIDDLLDLTRISQGKLELDRQLVEIGPLLDLAIQICCVEESSAGRVRVETDIAPELPPVEADGSRLTQVFWNLINNAVKFTPEGGTIRVRARRQEPPGAERAELEIEIQDTGIGIDPELLPRLFDAFEQGDPGITRRFGGLGLGLAISHAIVDLHGGELSAASAGPGQGSTFTLRLPAVVAAEAEWPAVPGPAVPVVAPPPAGEAPQRPLAILLVEDHADTAEAMAGLLEVMGHRVTAVATAAEALAAAEPEADGAPRFDLVVSDLGLPDRSGLDLMRELAGRHGLRGIALSGYGMEEDVRQSREAGFDRHLVKPVPLPALEQAIGEVAALLPRAGADSGLR
jgi:signal transduction histidine kinase/ActR/RegA family two-component response regulator